MEKIVKRARTKKGIRVGLSIAQESVLKEKLLKKVCSAAWVDAMFRSIEDVGPNGKPITVRFHEPGVYPPNADTSPMVRCAVCGVPTPPNCVGSTGVCLDCHCGWAPEAQEPWGESSWHTMMERVRFMRLQSIPARIGFKWE